MVEPAADYWFEGFRDWADKGIPRKTRTRVAVTTSVVCVIVACFLAFEDEFKERASLAARIDGPNGYISQVSALQAKLDLIKTSSDRLNQEITGFHGYKDQVNELQGSLGKTSEDLTRIQREKPQVVVQTKEVPVVIPSGSVQMTSEQRDKIRDIRVQLAAMLNEGQGIANEAVEKDAADPSAKANVWFQNVQAFLNSNLDASYVVRLNDASDIPSVVPGGPSVTQDQARLNLWHGMHNRLIRINQFITELSK